MLINCFVSLWDERGVVMKKVLMLVVVVVLAVSAVAFARGKSGDKNATGRITKLSVWASGASVSVRTSGGSLWLAYTVRWKDGYLRDYAPIKVRGTDSKSLTFQLRPQGISEVIVCLWRYKVSSSYCAKNRGGSACQYCRSMGFHMEGRQDRRVGS